MQSGGALRRQYEEPQNKPSHNPNRKPKGRLFIINMDYTIYIVVAILTFVGIVMIFSASYLTTATSTRFGNNPFFYLQRTAQWAVLGFISMNVMTVVPYRLIKKFAYIIYVVTVILLVLVQIMGFAAGGAQRWLDNIPIVGQFQPSEVSKAAIIFMIARLISDNPEYLHKWKGLFVCGGFVGLITVLVAGPISTGSMSAAIITVIIGFGMIFIASKHILRFVLGGAVGAGGLTAYLWYISQNPVDAEGGFRGERFLAWLDPFKYYEGKGFQIVQSLYAIASGGLFGLGIGQSRQTTFLPEAHNDMVFAIICEELGLVGAAVILLLFGIFIWRGIRVAVNAPDIFGSLTAAGIVLTIATQVIINVGVVTNTIPNTGITMPFVSYGGTSLLVCMTLSGILLNISRHTRE